MKVVHIESGLGNQMLSYCEYLALQLMNPHDEIYIENVIYDIPECSDYICQWNGYELKRIFGIEAKNLSTHFTSEEWASILNEIKATKFWIRNWNYPVHITSVLNKHGMNLKNIRGDFEAPDHPLMTTESKSWKSKFRKSLVGYHLKRILCFLNRRTVLRRENQKDLVFLKTNEDIFTGQRLCLKSIGNGIEQLDSIIKKTFVFPEFINKQDLEMLTILHSTNSVAIHARRGDMLGCNEIYYKYGYFKRAVKYIKKNVKNPVFVFFCDPGSIEWCKENEKIFALDFKRDTVYFVDWNKGENSYRDMQLMAECKHAIITNSSFGWWGAYLIKNPDKITCSPEFWIETTHHF